MTRPALWWLCVCIVSVMQVVELVGDAPGIVVVGDTSGVKADYTQQVELGRFENIYQP